MAPTAIAAPLNGKTRIAAFPLFVWMAEAKLPRAGRPTSHVATYCVRILGIIAACTEYRVSGAWGLGSGVHGQHGQHGGRC